jgi:hypothetical protein
LRRPSSSFAVMAVVTALALAGCPTVTEPAVIASDVTSTPDATAETDTVPTPDNKPVIAGVVRLTPEQMSNRIAHATGYRLGEVEEEGGLFYDDIERTYGVALGGVDFLVSSKRDPSVKVSTLLVVHSIAWTVADLVLYSELDIGPAERLFFTLADPDEDRPISAADRAGDPDDLAALQAGAKAWSEQLEMTFWRFFSRPPTAEEKDACKDLFLAGYAEDEWAGRGWSVLLYTLMTSLEFWSV